MKYNIHFIGNEALFKTNNISTASIKDVVDYCSTKSILGLDIETSRKYPKGMYPDTDKDVYKAGLDPYLSKVIMLQIGDLENVFVIDTRAFDNQSLSPLINLLNWNKNLLLVGHNLKFEGKHLKHNYGIRLNNVWDTMLCEINLTNGLNLGYSLADLSERYIGVKKTESIDLFTNFKSSSYDDFNEFAIDYVDNEYIDKSIRMGFINIGDNSFTETQIRYGVDDIIYPLLIRELQLKSEYNPIICHKLENKFSQVLADLELQGLYIDPNKWMEVYNENLPIYRSLKKKLDDYVVNNVPEFTGSADLFSGSKGTCTIQWSSSKQVISLFKHLGFCPKEKSKQTKRMEYTVGDKALFKLLTNENKQKYYSKKQPDIEDTQTLILIYLLYKKYEQSCTTFGKDWLRYIHPITKKVHSSFRQILNTGRISSTNPNQQNIPSDKRYRKCFTAPKGYKIVNADYAAQEVRVLAEVSKVQLMQDFFIKGDSTFGDDFHSFTATNMFKIIYGDSNFYVPPAKLADGSNNPEFNHKKERDAAKAINFKLNYGGSAYTLKDDFGVEEDEAQKFIDNYMAAFPGLKKDFEETKKFAVENGYINIDNYTGRRWFFSSFDYMNQVHKEVQELYPPDYKSWSREKKDEWKAENKVYTGHLWKTYFLLRGKLERTALNYRIQGLSGGMTKLAGILIRNWSIENNIDYAFLNNIIHDEINAECIDDVEKLKLFSKIIEDNMIKAGTYFCKKVPMGATAVIGDYWAH